MEGFDWPVNHLTGLDARGLERRDVVDVDGWPVGHLCMRIHPSVPGIFCRDIAGHGGRCRPAGSDIAKRQGERMPGTEGS